MVESIFKIMNVSKTFFNFHVHRVVKRFFDKDKFSLQILKFYSRFGSDTFAETALRTGLFYFHLLLST